MRKSSSIFRERTLEKLLYVATSLHVDNVIYDISGRLHVTDFFPHLCANEAFGVTVCLPYSLELKSKHWHELCNPDLNCSVFFWCLFKIYNEESHTECLLWLFTILLLLFITVVVVLVRFAVHWQSHDALVTSQRWFSWEPTAAFEINCSELELYCFSIWNSTILHF